VSVHGRQAFARVLERLIPAPISPGSGRASLIVGVGAFVLIAMMCWTGWRSFFRPADAIPVLLARQSGLHLAYSRDLPLPEIPFSPLAQLSLELDAVLWPRAPVGYYLFNLLLHGATCALLYRLLSRRLNEPIVAAVAAGLFAITPAATTNIFAVTARPEILSLALLLGSMVMVGRDPADTKWHHAVLGSALYAASLLSCLTSLLALPAVVILTTTGNSRWWSRSVLFACVACFYVAVFWARVSVEAALGLSSRSLARLWATVMPISDARLEFWIFALISTLVVVAAGLRRPRGSIWLTVAGLLWFLPALCVVPSTAPSPTDADLNSMYIFLPGLGLFMGVVSASAIRSCESRQSRAFLFFLLGGIAVSHLKQTSYYSVSNFYRTRRLDRRIAQISSFLKEHGTRSRIAFVVNLNPDSGPFVRDSRRYYDLLVHCQANDGEKRPSIVAYSTESYVWGSPQAYPGLEIRRTFKHEVGLVRIQATEELVADAGTLLIDIEPDTPVVVDARSSIAWRPRLGGRYPAWFEDLRDWSPADMRVTPSDGMVKLESGPIDPFLTSPRFYWPAGAVERIRIRLAVEKPGTTPNLRVYWESAANPGFSEGRAADVEMPAAAPVGDGAPSPQIVDLYLASHLPWLASGDITRIRIDPPAGSTIVIGSVELLPSAGSSVRSVDVLKTSWDPRSLANWRLSLLRQGAGPTCMQSIGPDPWLAADVALNPLAEDTLRLLMSCRADDPAGQASQAAQIYFKTSTMKDYNERCKLMFTVLPDGSDHEYRIKLFHNYLWVTAGTITGLRIDPMSAPGEVCLRQVQLLGEGGSEAHVGDQR